MTEIIIRDGIVSSLTTQPTRVWDAIKNGDNNYGTFDGNSYVIWNEFSLSNSYNLFSYFDENHDMELPEYYEWKSDFHDTLQIPWSLYGLKYNGFFKYSGVNNISFDSNNFALGAVIQLVSTTITPFNSGFNIFSIIATTNTSSDSPSWIPFSLDYDVQTLSPSVIHRFHFRSGTLYATITINSSNFDITKPHLYSITGTPNDDNQFINLYIDNLFVASLIYTGADITSYGWKSYNTKIPNCFIIGGNVGLQLPSPNTDKQMGIYSVFFYNDSYNHSEIFDLCKYRYNVPDVNFNPSVTYTELNPPYVSKFGSTFNFGQYMSIL